MYLAVQILSDHAWPAPYKPLVHQQSAETQTASIHP